MTVDLSGLLQDKSRDKMHWGSALGLWNIVSFKIIGMQTLDLFLAQAKDKDLKYLLNMGVEIMMISHIEKIQAFLLKEGVRQAPTVPARLNLDIQKMEPNSIYTDQQIGSFIREIYRYGLLLDMGGYTDCTRGDIRKLLLDIITEDLKGFDGLLDLLHKKNWLISPPTI